MEIKDQAEADAYLEELVTHSVVYGGLSRKEALELNRRNLGYFAGYYNSENGWNFCSNASIPCLDLSPRMASPRHTKLSPRA